MQCIIVQRSHSPIFTHRGYFLPVSMKCCKADPDPPDADKYDDDDSGDDDDDDGRDDDDDDDGSDDDSSTEEK